MTELSKMASSSGCGCGGGGCGGSSGSCSQCGQECGGGPLQRPLFFSGQLLTEEDLQLLSDYAATKMRLHNRYLHGAGVVCGLQVVCHPCGGGQVIVQSGAALDCCGNDIYVPCAVELDINDMVNSLRLEKRGGYDCGDPCEKPCDDSPDDARCIERSGRRYCLYVRYCEELEEPVTPYLTGGDCALQVCKPTRIREGYKFELRCPEDESAPDDLFSRLLCCIGDLEGAERTASDSLAAREFGQRRMMASAQMASGPVPFGESDRAELAKVKYIEPLVPNDGVSGSAQPKTAEDSIRAYFDSYQAVASAVVRFDLQTDAAKAELSKATPDLKKEVETARYMVQQTSQPLKERLGRLSSARDRVVAAAIIDQGAELTAEGPNLAMPKGSQALYYAYGVPTSPEIQRTFRNDAEQLREWLLQRIESKALSSDCRLRHDLLSIELPASESDDDDTLYESQLKLIEILFRYLLDCICAALNPPCQPCLDPAVKLACLTVDDCEVVRICNLERTFVLSGPAIRYWIPFLHMIGELFEKACCELDVRVGRGRKAGDKKFLGRDSEYRRGYMVATQPMVSNEETPAMLRSLFRLANIDERTGTTRINALGSFGRLAGRSVADDFSLGSGDLRTRMKGAVSMAAAPDATEAAKAVVEPMQSDVAELRAKVAEIHELSENRVAPLANNVEALGARVEAAHEAVQKVAPLAQDLAELRDRVVAARAAEEATRAATERHVTKSIDDMRKEVAGIDKRLAGDSTLVKELRKALEEQRKRSDALEARLGKLEPKKG